MSIQARVAKRYSKAFVHAAQDAGKLTEEVTQLQVFCELAKTNRELNRYLQNVTIKSTDKVAVLKEVCKKIGGSDSLGRFLTLLASKGRLDCLDEIELAVVELVNKINNIRHLSITTSVPLTAAGRNTVVQSLAQKLSAEIRLDEIVDPNVWGGAVVQIGSTFYDGSLKGKLKRLREELVKEN